jgi:uncharacterized protein YqgC (DUF456 family)
MTSILWAILLVAVLLAGWGLNLFGLPGNWINLAALACYAWRFPAGQRLSITWWVVGGVLLLAILGEVLELVAGAAGAARAGASRRSAVLALGGSLAGSLLGAVIGLPIPLIGSVIAIVLGAALGALGGAMLGECWKGRTLDIGWQVGQAAFWGRLLGTAGKLTVGAAIVAVALAGLALR